MDFKTFADFQTPIGQEGLQTAMALAPQEPDFLVHFQRMYKDYPREIPREALETAILRGKVKNKISPGLLTVFHTRGSRTGLQLRDCRSPF